MRSSVNDIAEKVRDARKPNRGELVAVRYERSDVASIDMIFAGVFRSGKWNIRKIRLREIREDASWSCPKEKTDTQN